MKKISLCPAILLSCYLAILLSCSGGGKTLATINGKAITDGDLDFLSTINPRLKAQLATPFGKKQVLDNLVEQELLYQAALKKGLQRDGDVKAKFELYKKVIIAQAFVESEMKRNAREYYDQHKSEFEKLQLAHIEIKYVQPEDKKAKKAHSKPAKDKITRTKDAALKLANEAKARLNKGEEFAKVAKDVSEDTISKNNGGDLGKASKDEARLERRGFGPLLEKAYTMQVGEIAGPIETKEGYHIITVTKGAELEPFEAAEQAIMFKVQGDQRNKLIADLKKNAKIAYPGEEKKEAPPAAATSSPAPTAPKPEAK